ncbi:GDP-mannose transporter into the lumen of the Golgi [Exophiala sideris]|uniref:GDP-mannose transporter n=1 Tax=Exophiala sideris TaxID=1016849 RepID=A0ABR0J3P7_9EURO|nr:GDP-mannose transporter into the lumen of the Golgi [Exophiala sideris]KAK5033766.1 GDP-mannose transporter into the lumen of the Golgi [Exophiala sideris]KAK5055588.1 GDP-mannose transporter into the lumen of the Golgi [Exophiala sideris]KAK5180028.1 GDP-mannose transporter into the lumen of the Golgi [Eurotiomycetes sp. CCFEE 6388]
MSAMDDKESGKRESFLLKPAAPIYRARADRGMGSFFSQLESNPGAAVLAYCFSSISMTVVNKYVVSGSSWNLNFLYLAIQSVICTAAILGLKQMGMLPNLAALEIGKAKRWLPVSIAFVGMIFTSTKSLQFLSVPVYTIFKNLTIIVIAYGEVRWFGGSVTPLLLLSFGFMVLSSIVAAWADIQAALNGVGHSVETDVAISTLHAGYVWMGLNVFCTASYVLGTRKFITSLNFKDWDTMFYNNLLSLPIMVICSLVTEDWTPANLAKNFPAESRNNLMIGMLYSGLGAIFISYSSAWCIRKTSSTTYSFVGYLNKLPLAISGIFFFGAPVTFGSVSAILLGFFSGLIYGYGKMKQREQSKQVLPTTRPAMSASSQSQKDVSNS